MHDTLKFCLQVMARRRHDCQTTGDPGCVKHAGPACIRSSSLFKGKAVQV